MTGKLKYFGHVKCDLERIEVEGVVPVDRDRDQPARSWGWGIEDTLDMRVH